MISTEESEPVWVDVKGVGNLPLVVNVSLMITEAWEEVQKDKLRETVKMQSCGMQEF